MDKKESSYQFIRQGDIGFLKGDNISLPNEAKVVKRVDGRIIVARGEATEHAHAIDTSDVQMYELNGIRWLVAEKEFVLGHEEHHPITFPPGIWRIQYQREYNPINNRRVQD